MKPIENKIMLITYGNTLGKNLTELKDNLKKYIPSNAIGINVNLFLKKGIP